MERNNKTVEISCMNLVSNQYLNAFFLSLEVTKLFMKLKFIWFVETTCLIYSQEIALMNCEKAQLEPSFDVLRNLINMEFQRNINEYASFLVSRNPYEEVRKYLNEKSYLHEIGDIIINPLNASVAPIQKPVN